MAFHGANIMKLPKSFNLYKHNEYTDKLTTLSQNISKDCGDYRDIKNICEINLKNLKEMLAIIVHLELALDEVLKLEQKHE